MSYTQASLTEAWYRSSPRLKIKINFSKRTAADKVQYVVLRNYLYAWPLVGQSGYQWSSYLSHKSFWSFSANSSALASPSLPRATIRRLRKWTPAFTSLFMIYTCRNREKKNLGVSVYIRVCGFVTTCHMANWSTEKYGDEFLVTNPDFLSGRCGGGKNNTVSLQLY